jgi:pimeloyl-ACP methyl ester carboxylesterase
MPTDPFPPSDPSPTPGGAAVRPDVEKGFQERQVRIPSATGVITGDLVVPPWAQGLVLFAHGTGSSRQSPRNQFVAAQLQAAGLATLLLDLLTEEEEREDAAAGFWRYDVDVHMQRMIEALRWTRRHPIAGRLGFGFYGASTGGATALVAAAKLGPLVRAVVSRGGRIDFAGQVLPLISAPTLLIAGGADEPTLGMNRGALVRLRCPKELAVVPGATHLFEEPGALDQVAALTVRWFQQHLLTLGRKKENQPADPA